MMISGPSILRKCFLLAAMSLCLVPATAHAALFTVQSTIFITAGNNAGTGILGQIDPVFIASGTVGTTNGTVLLSGSSINLATQDVFVFDMTLSAGSTAVDLIRVGMGLAISDLVVNPKGAGIWVGDPGEVPTGIIASLVVLAADFQYGPTVVNSTNLQAGESTVRLFVTYQKSTGGAGALVSGQTASFMISPAGSATSFTVQGKIIPEPATLLLLGAGLAALGLRGKFGRGKAA